MPEDRVLVFVQTLANGQQMAKALQCDFYRGTTDTTITNSDREAMVERWYSGIQNTMVATDAFGPGNDYPHVRYVYFVGSPRGVVDMLQMAGRGGRDGNVAHIVFYHLSGQGFPSSPADKHVGRPELQILHRRPTARCWREVCSKFVDGVGVKCTDTVFDWRCPACSAGPTPLPTRPSAWFKVTGNISIPIVPTLPPARLLPAEPISSPQVGASRPRAPSTSLALPLSAAPPSSIASVMGSGTAFTDAIRQAKRYRQDRDALMEPLVQRVTQAVGIVSGHCAMCHLCTGEVVPTHAGGIIRCPSMLKLLQDTEGEEFRQGGQYLDWKRKLEYVKGSEVCWRCHLPFLHDRVHQPKQGKIITCNPGHEDMVMPVVYWAYMNRDMRAKMMSKFHGQWVTDLDYVRWLGAKGKKGGFTNVMEVFMWVVETRFSGSYIV